MGTSKSTKSQAIVLDGVGAGTFGTVPAASLAVTTAKQARKQLLEHAPEIIDALSKAAKSPNPRDVMTPHQIAVTQLLWPTLSKMICDESDTVQVSVESSRDVLKLIGDGTLNFDQALQLMTILRTDSDITDVKQMAAQLDELVAGQRG